jgi:hypothetical protein
MFEEEFFAAEIADHSLSQFLWLVAIKMTNQRSLVVEHLTATITFGDYFPLVDSKDVTFEAIEGREDSLADLALLSVQKIEKMQEEVQDELDVWLTFLSCSSPFQRISRP